MSLTNHKEFLTKSPVFSIMNEEETSFLTEQLISLPYKFGQTIVEQGAQCEGLYVIFSGSVRLFVQENGKEISMGLRKAGDIFAEVNVLRNSCLEYTARATADCEILKIPRASLTYLWEQNPKIEKYMARYAAVKTTGGLVSRLFDLKGVSGKKEFESMIETIGIKRVDSGKIVLKQDTFDDRRLYVIRQGKVRVLHKEGEQEFQIAVLGRGETFGERALLLSDNQPATVIAETDSTFLVIPDTTVKKILNDHPTLRTSFEERISSFEQELERQQKLAGQKVGRWRFSAVGAAGVGEKVLDHFPLIEQDQEMDCGAACLAMVCRHYGIQATLEQLREFADIDTGGATLESLATACERLGFIARGVSVTFTELNDLELPLIAHWQGYHYIVVYGVSRHAVYVADPAVGFRKMTLSEFEKGWDGTCLLLERDKQQAIAVDVDSANQSHHNFFRLVSPLYLPVLMSSALSGLLIVVAAFVSMYLFNGLVANNNSFSPGALALAFLFVSGLGCAAILLQNLLSGRLIYKISHNATSEFIQHILYQRLEFFERRKVSDLLGRMKDNETVWTFVAKRGVELSVAVWTLLLSWAALFYFDVTLATSYVAMHLPVVVILWFYGNRNPRLIEVDSGAAETAINDMIQGIEIIKAQGAEYWMRCRWESFTGDENVSKHQYARKSSFLAFTIRLVQSLALTILVWKGSILFLESQLTVGGLVAVFLLAALGAKPLGDLTGGWLEWQIVRPCLERVQSIHSLAPEQSSDQTTENIILPELKGKIRIENLYFRYQKHSPYVIEGLQCDIEERQWVNVVGPMGSGKSTLSKLLMGFYSIDEGCIDIDTYPLNLIEKGSFRRQIGFLPQRPLLISGTLMDNIALGVRAPLRKRVVDVCRQVGLSDWINQLPAGYDHTVAEQDELDSDDLIQRLGLARALVRGPAVLILDQALSTLNLNAESDILNEIRTTYPNTTMITFSDRVNPHLKSDQVFMLYNGRITEKGSPTELADQDGLYRQLLYA